MSASRANDSPRRDKVVQRRPLVRESSSSASGKEDAGVDSRLEGDHDQGAINKTRRGVEDPTVWFNRQKARLGPLTSQLPGLDSAIQSNATVTQVLERSVTGNNHKRASCRTTPSGHREPRRLRMGTSWMHGVALKRRRQSRERWRAVSMLRVCICGCWTGITDGVGPQWLPSTATQGRPPATRTGSAA